MQKVFSNKKHYISTEDGGASSSRWKFSQAKATKKCRRDKNLFNQATVLPGVQSQ